MKAIKIQTHDDEKYNVCDEKYTKLTAYQTLQKKKRPVNLMTQQQKLSKMREREREKIGRKVKRISVCCGTTSSNLIYVCLERGSSKEKNL